MNLFRNLLNTSIIKFISLVGALAFSWLVSYLLPISEAGRFFSVLAITPGIAVILGFGADQTVLRVGSTRYASEGLDGLSTVMSESARYILKRCIFVLLATAIGAAILLSVFPDSRQNVALWVLALALAPFFAALLPTAMNFRIRRQYRRSILSEPSAAMSLSALVLLASTLMFAGSFWVTYGIFGFFIVLLSVPLFRTILGSKREKIDHDAQFGVTQIAQYLLQWGVIGQIAFYASAAEIAVLSLSLRLVMAINFVLIIVNTVNSSEISRMIQTGERDNLRQLLRAQTPYLIVLGIGAALSLAILAPFAFSTLGPEYKDAANITRILIVGQLVNVFVGPANIMLNMSGNARIASKITICIGLPVTALVWPFYHFGGMYGAAILIGLSLSAVSIISAGFAARYVGIRSIWPSKG